MTAAVHARLRRRRRCVGRVVGVTRRRRGRCVLIVRGRRCSRRRRGSVVRVHFGRWWCVICCRSGRGNCRYCCRLLLRNHRLLLLLLRRRRGRGNETRIRHRRRRNSRTTTWRCWSSVRSPTRGRRWYCLPRESSIRSRRCRRHVRERTRDRLNLA